MNRVKKYPINRCNNCYAELYQMNGWHYCPSCKQGNIPPVVQKPPIDLAVVFGPTHHRRSKKPSMWDTGMGQVVSVILGGAAGVAIAVAMVTAMGLHSKKPTEKPSTNTAIQVGGSSPRKAVLVKTRISKQGRKQHHVSSEPSKR